MRYCNVTIKLNKGKSGLEFSPAQLGRAHQRPIIVLQSGWGTRHLNVEQTRSSDELDKTDDTEVSLGLNESLNGLNYPLSRISE